MGFLLLAVEIGASVDAWLTTGQRSKPLPGGFDQERVVPIKKGTMIMAEQSAEAGMMPILEHLKAGGCLLVHARMDQDSEILAIDDAWLYPSGPGEGEPVAGEIVLEMFRKGLLVREMSLPDEEMDADGYLVNNVFLCLPSVKTRNSEKKPASY